MNKIKNSTSVIITPFAEGSSELSVWDVFIMRVYIVCNAYVQCNK